MFELRDFFSTVLVGVGATAVLDLWSFLLSRVFKVVPANYCMVGRWVSGMSAGVYWHSNITTSPKRKAECMIGWASHYILGVVFAYSLVILMTEQWLREPTFLPALLFGVITVLIPYLIMQPAFGFGIAAAKTPKPMLARLKSLMAHTVFGVGLYISAYVLQITNNMMSL